MKSSTVNCKNCDLIYFFNFCEFQKTVDYRHSGKENGFNQGFSHRSQSMIIQLLTKEFVWNAQGLTSSSSMKRKYQSIYMTSFEHIYWITIYKMESCKTKLFKFTVLRLVQFKAIINLVSEFDLFCWKNCCHSQFCKPYNFFSFHYYSISCLKVDHSETSSSFFFVQINTFTICD